MACTGTEQSLVRTKRAPHGSRIAASPAVDDARKMPSELAGEWISMDILGRFPWLQKLILGTASWQSFD